MSRFPKSIENFKATLQGGGVRPTMFQVELTFPDSTVVDTAQMANEGIFLVKGSQIPESTIGMIEVPFRGRKLKVSGDRSYAQWPVTVTNDVTFGLRKGFEKWSELIQNMNFALGANELNQYYATAIVRQLDRDGNQLRAYGFEGIWPSSVGAIELDMGDNDTVEEFEVTFEYQYWNAIGSEGNPESVSVDIDPTADKTAVST